MEIACPTDYKPFRTLYFEIHLYLSQIQLHWILKPQPSLGLRVLKVFKVNKVFKVFQELLLKRVTLVTPVQRVLKVCPALDFACSRL